MAHDPAQAPLQLPTLAARPADITRMLRELEAVNEAMLQAKLRSSAEAGKLPKTSQLLDQTATMNKLDLSEEAHRQQLVRALTVIHDKAPVFHMSFNADPSTEVIGALVKWFRSEVHPNILLTVGLQPNLGAGSILRTTNKMFDLSLRQDFARKRDILVQKLAEGLHRPAAAAPAPTEEAPAPAGAPAGGQA